MWEFRRWGFKEVVSDEFGKLGQEHLGLVVGAGQDSCLWSAAGGPPPGRQSRAE